MFDQLQKAPFTLIMEAAARLMAAQDLTPDAAAKRAAELYDWVMKEVRK